MAKLTSMVYNNNEVYVKWGPFARASEILAMAASVSAIRSIRCSDSDDRVRKLLGTEPDITAEVQNVSSTYTKQIVYSIPVPSLIVNPIPSAVMASLSVSGT